MTAIDNTVKVNKIDEKEITDLANKIYHSFLVFKTSKLESIESKDLIINSFINFLSNYIETDLIKSNQEKMFFLDQIDKLILQKELLQLKRRELKMSDIKKAGTRLGKKSQSAFSKK